MDSTFNYDDWISQRGNDPVKLSIKDDMSDVISFANKYDDIAFYSDPNLNNRLAVCEGIPVTNLVTVYPLDYMMFNDEPFAGWRDITPKRDESCYFTPDRLLKYNNSGNKVDFDYDGALFLPSYITKEVAQIINEFIDDCICNRKKVAIKPHPALGFGLELINTDSKYAVVYNDADTIDLVRNAVFVSSYNSSVCLIAMMMGKPVSSLARFSLSTIIPIFKPSRIDKDDLAKFLYWYKNVYSIDIHHPTDDRVALRVDVAKSCCFNTNKIMAQEVLLHERV
jgi:hypothetical protein